MSRSIVSKSHIDIYMSQIFSNLLIIRFVFIWLHQKVSKENRNTQEKYKLTLQKKADVSKTRQLTPKLFDW